ncbi:MAG: glycerate kinase, partial [Nitrospirota bacterium]|nr:glycerate kinase [Nitrospirota bacterium]
MSGTPYQDLSRILFYSSLKAVDPYEAVRSYTDAINSLFREGKYTQLLVIGFGKASCQMAKALEAHLTVPVSRGMVITKYGHCAAPYKPEKIAVREAGHPMPDESGLKGAGEVMRMLQDTDAGTMVVFLISGGGSALLASPYEGISLDEKQRVTGLLLAAGADIFELNTVRKHISGVKGGRLAEIAYPARVISLILSDVIGDRLDVIASGPTSPDKTTFSDAIEVLKKYDLFEKAPQAVRDLLLRGEKGSVRETPKEDNPAFEKVTNTIIGSNIKALEAAQAKAASLGFQTEIISAEITGEARQAARQLAKKALDKKRDKKTASPLCLISGGETTVTVKGSGLGGRNMELALSFAFAIDGAAGITLLSAGTDGTDGPTDAAGAVVDGQTIAHAKSLGLAPHLYLENNDSYNF